MEISDELAKKKSGQGFWDEEKEHEVVQRYIDLCEEVILNISKDKQKYFSTNCVPL